MSSQAEFKFPLTEVVEGAIGPFGPYSMGYLNPGGSGQGYICVLKISTGLVDTKGLDVGTADIVAFDRCEKNDAYIGQINLLTASSFCGINGAVWGYDLAIADSLAAGTLQPVFTERRQDGKEIPVFTMAPLLDTGVRLFGVDGRRRFNPLPGAHIICANKGISAPGPQWVWAVLALAMAEDRNTEANLFIEDVSTYGDEHTSGDSIGRFLAATVRKVANSIILTGADQGVLFKEIFIGYRARFVPAGSIGCALTCAPYILLARNAVPDTGPASMLDMTITEWEHHLGLPPLPPFDTADIEG